MSIDSPKDWEGLRRVARVVRETLEAMRRAVRPGVSTAELEALAREVFDRHGARSAPTEAYGFPGVVLISINDEVVHGIPGPRRIAPGDVVKLDVTPELDGYIADAAITVTVAPVSEVARRLERCARRALHRAIQSARAGTPIRTLGRVVEREARRDGFRVVRELGGHGVGRAIHEPPTIWNYDQPLERGRLTEGLVLTIEPILAAGSGRVFEAEDGWTVKTADGSLAAHVEHTLVVTSGRPQVLTA